MKEFKIEPGRTPPAVDRTRYDGVEWPDGKVTVRCGDGTVRTFASRQNAYEELVKIHNREWWDLSKNGAVITADLWALSKPWEAWHRGYGYAKLKEGRWRNAHWDGVKMRILGPLDGKVRFEYWPHEIEEWNKVEWIPTEELDLLEERARSFTDSAPSRKFLASIKEFRRQRGITGYFEESKDPNMRSIN